jgi:hypothetical protein
MKGIYLTEEGKKEIEARIAEIEKDEDEYSECCGIATTVYQQILSSATILPVEEDWNDVLGNTERDDCVYSCKSNYQNGVIIKS